VRARKRFGQHFLERAWVDKLIALVAPRAADRFVEIGPGQGALTLPLAESGARIRAVEIDRDLAAELLAVAPPNVTVVTGDVLALGPAELFGDDSGQADKPGQADEPGQANESAGRVRIVGNLPYNLSSPILFRLLELWRQTQRPIDATLMLQREVAVRIAAGPGNGDYGPLGVLTALHADVDIILQLPPGAFRPPPKVHSSVIRLRFRPAAVDVGDYARFERLVRTVFQQRRKTVANALKPLLAQLQVEGDAEALLRQAEIDPRLRPEKLSLADLARLAGVLR
jgi:16S rRNA (adenine1518-N6/adenine1519-N6)-dimethyltransferase